MSEWQEIRLGSVLEKIIGGGTPSKNKPEYWNGDIFWCSVKDMSSGKIKLDKTEDRISEEGLRKSSANLIKAGTVITSTRMGLGRAFINEVDMAINQDLKALIPNEKIDNIFLLYTILIKGEELESLGTGSTVKGITLDTLKNVSISLPPLPTQRRIASILSAYDDLIENNLKRIKLLEELAQRTYEEWFVKFRIPGEDLKLNEETGLPEGWELSTLKDVCNRIQSGGTPSRNNASFWNKGTINWFKTKELQDSWLLDSEEKITPDALSKSSAKLFPANSILMAIYASPTLGRLGILENVSSCNQAAIGFEVDTTKVSNQWLYFKLFQLRDRFNSIARGAGQQNISGELVKEQDFVLPTITLINKFTDFSSSIFQQTKTLEKQNFLLKESRDLLLPRLMSGAIHVDAAGEQLGLVAEEQTKYGKK